MIYKSKRISFRKQKINVKSLKYSLLNKDVFNIKRLDYKNASINRSMIHYLYLRTFVIVKKLYHFKSIILPYKNLQQKALRHECPFLT